MIKLFKRVEESLRYHEAWVSDGKIIEHWGRVGNRGSRREHVLAHGQGDDAAIEEVLRDARISGFAPLDDADLVTLLIEYIVTGMGTRQDLEKRNALEERIDQTLGWRGLGHCDGGSIGSGTMEVCCLVVDADVATQVIKADLKGTPFQDYSRVFVE